MPCYIPPAHGRVKQFFAFDEKSPLDSAFFAPAKGRIDVLFFTCYPSSMNWYQNVILTKLREGMTYAEAASTVGIHRQTLWRWISASEEFRNAVAKARQDSQPERSYRLWLRHPFRGKRPSSGKLLITERAMIRPLTG